MKSMIIYDWISFSYKINNPQYIINLLGLQEFSWEQIKGSQGYSKRLYCNSISIHFDGFNDGCWVEISGQGCRFFEEYTKSSYEELFKEILNNELYNITRIDIAFDDHDDILDISKIVSDTQVQNYISKATEWEIRLSSKGTTVNIGSPKSDVLIRIYDKAAERGKVEENWIRIEIQLRDARAYEFLRLDDTIGNKFRGVLLNYLRYIKPSKTDTNKRRWEIRKYGKK